MKNHGNIMLTVISSIHPECARLFGSGALLDIDWEADIVEGTIDHECGGGALEWSEKAEVIERMHIVGLTIIGDNDEETYNFDGIGLLPRAVRAELCAEAREICEASR